MSEHHESVDQAAQRLRLGERQSVFRPVSMPKRRSLAGLIPALVLFAFVLVLFGSAGLLTSFIGIGVSALFVLMIGAAVAGITMTTREARGDQEMHVFDHGVVIRGPKGRVLPYRFDETRLIRHGVKPAGSSDRFARWSYGLLNPVTPPVLMGQGVAIGAVWRNAGDVDLTNLLRVAQFERIDVWGPALEDAITRAHLPRTLQELSAGREVAFGPATALPHGLAIDGKVLPWGDISALRIEGGFLRVKVKGRFFTSSVKANDVPNFLVLAAVVNHFSAVPLE
ncbi:DUF6585 family protein [Amycolatopsis albispora]|uniref:Uncharacterized protein n=1 Tax=Amycolatopsis albispora TaxID=1804986 RepID=A0A344L0P3_9PSEU|nr:DUF6585 family protein [Amycolatopsis albispora]AXB41617.1 hypothetical protein A4R43_03010 [Amycolatopsis albispora]